METGVPYLVLQDVSISISACAIHVGEKGMMETPFEFSSKGALNNGIPTLYDVSHEDRKGIQKEGKKKSRKGKKGKKSRKTAKNKSSGDLVDTGEPAMRVSGGDVSNLDLESPAGWYELDLEQTVSGKLLSELVRLKNATEGEEDSSIVSFERASLDGKTVSSSEVWDCK